MAGNLSRIFNFLLYVLLGMSVVMTGLYYMGGITPETVDALYPEPVFTNVFMGWAYVLLAIALVSVVGFAVYSLFMDPRGAVQTLIVLGIFAVIIGTAYMMSDGTPLNILGYNGPDNVPSMLRFADTILFTMYILFVVTVLSIIVTEIWNAFK